MKGDKCPSSGMGCTSDCPDALRGVCGIYTPPNPEQRRINVDPWAAVPRKDYVWTIMWRYSDNSAAGVLNVAFRKEEDAQDMLKLLDEHSDSKHFSLHQSVLKW